MYKFVDTINHVNSKEELPAEAMSINGTYIENEIEGYRTLTVTGRELLESEITDRQIGNSDGTEFQYKRDVPRVITVSFALKSDTPEEFREKFNKLNQILNQEEARLVFYDEPDKYFVGTKSTVDEVSGGQLSVTGKFDIYCSDPYKHSAVEKTFPAVVNADGVLEAVIVNNGTQAVPASYTIEHNHENGYIGIVSEHGVIQLGNIKELDGDVKKKSELLLNFRTPAAFNAMTSGQAILAVDYPKDGSFKTVTSEGKQWLALNDISSGQSWHGAGKKITLPADTTGVSGGTDFYAQSKVWFESGRTDQTGLVEFSIGDESGKHLASIKLAKYELGVNRAYAIFSIQGVEKLRYGFVPDRNGVTTSAKGQIYIKKSGELFEFYFGGGKWQYRVPEASSKRALTVSVFLGQHGTRGNSNLLTRMFLDYIFFQKNNVTYWYDVPNRYRNESVVFVDGSASKVYVDKVVSMEDEVLGSNYFQIPPGETKIQFYYSDFCNPAPTISVKIREAYL